MNKDSTQKNEIYTVLAFIQKPFLVIILKQELQPDLSKHTLWQNTEDTNK